MWFDDGCPWQCHPAQLILLPSSLTMICCLKVRLEFLLGLHTGDEFNYYMSDWVTSKMSHWQSGHLWLYDFSFQFSNIY